MTSKYGMTGGEAIDGYKVWTVPATAADESWLAASLPPQIHLVSTLIRDNLTNPPSGFSYDVLYTKPAGYTRPQLDVTVDKSDFQTAAQGYFDIVIQPFTFRDPEDAESIEFGPFSRIEDVILFDSPVPPPTDDNGPQYRWNDSVLPGDHGAGTPTWGIQSVDQLPGAAGNNGAAQTYGLQITTVNADDVDAFGNWTNPAPQVIYDVFVISRAPGDPNPAVTAAELFVPGNIVSALEFGESTPGGTSAPTVTVSLEMTAAWWQSNGVPMNVPGSRIWMGVQARQSGGNDPGEYVHPPDDWDANDSVEELAVVDLDPPYFIEENADYDRNALRQDNSLLYDGLRIVPYSTGVAVYCRRAIDGPAYADDENLTYRCYFSSSAFDISTYSAQQNVSFQRAYSATEFPDGNYDREQYIAFIPGLTAGTTYWFYVVAEDNANGIPKQNRSVNGDVTSWDFPALTNTGISIASGLPYAGANMVGEIVANQNGVYMVYPGQGFFVQGQGIPAPPNPPALLLWGFAVPSYSELPGGSTVNMTTQTNITGWDQGSSFPLNAPQVITSGRVGNETGLLPAYMGTVSTGLIIRPGFPGGPNVPHTAVFNYTSSLDDPITPNLQYGMVSLERNLLGSWTNATWQLEPNNSGTVFWTRVVGCNAADHTYVSPLTSSFVTTAILSSAYWNAFPSVNRVHELAGIGTPGSITWPGYITVDNDQYRDQGFGHTISSDTEMVSGAPIQPAAYPLPTAGFLSTKQPLYMLSNSSMNVDDYRPTDPPPYFFSKLKISTTNDPQNPTSWAVSDLITGSNSLPGLIPGIAGSVVGPNAIASSWQPDGQISRVYAVYCNAIEQDFNLDGQGLTVAVLNNAGMGIPPWNASSLVDDTYSVLDIWNIPGNDVVDLEVQADAKASWVDFDRLGCTYVSPAGQLILAETIGNGGSTTWQPIWPTGNSVAVINQGDIRWVKLAYYDSNVMDPLRSKAYVLYCIRTQLTPPLYEVRLWVQP